MEKYRQYIDVQWWNGIDKRNLENWIRNFGTKEDIAKLILDNVIFYNAAQMKAYTRFLLCKLMERVYMSKIRENNYRQIDDSILFAQWENYINNTVFLPAAKQTDPTSSAHKIIRYWRTELKKGDDLFSTIGNIEAQYKKGVRRFVLVDDFSGSGKQMQEVLKEKIKFNGKEIELGLLPYVVNDVEIIIAVYVIHEEAKKNLTENYKLSLLYVDLITDDFNYLNDKAILYDKLSPKKKSEVIKEIRYLVDRQLENDENLSKLSAYILNIPVVFEHGCPNNTLLLLFAHSEDWQQLFKRGKEL